MLVLRLPRPGIRRRSTQLPGDRQQRRQQGQRRDHREEDRDRRGRRDPVEEVEAEQEHPQQRDDHGDPGEQHRSAGGVDRRDRRVALLHAFVEAVAESGQDEEGVVDPDAEADHRRQDDREVGGVEDVGPDRHQAEADAEGEERGDQRQAHRHDRAEGQQQDHDRGEQSDREGGVAFFLFCFLDRVAAELDVQPFAVRALGDGDDFSRLFFVQLVVRDVELDRRVGDLAVIADRRGAAFLVRAGDFADVRELGDFGEDRVPSSFPRPAIRRRRRP